MGAGVIGRVAVGAAATGALVGAQALGYAANAEPSGVASWLRLLVGVAIVVVVLVAARAVSS